MKNSKKNYFFIIGLILILILSLMYFFGNPISSIRSSKNIKSYIVERYPSISGQIDSKRYDSKTGLYTFKITSNDPDIYFYLTTNKKGQILSDDYNRRIKSYINTEERLLSNYDKFISLNLLKYRSDTIALTTSIDFDQNKLELNKNYAPGDVPGYKRVYLKIKVNKDNFSKEKIKEILLEVNNIFADDEIDEITIALMYENTNKKIQLNNFKKENIKEDVLDKLIEDNLRNNL